jgi:putative ATP-binding cassette transporter
MFIDRPNKEAAQPGAGLLPQMGMMIRALLGSSVRNQLFVLGGAVFAVIVATAYGQIRLNRWNQPFYDALAHRDFRQFMVQLGVFGVITFSLLVLNVGQRWLAEMLKLKLREGLVRDLVNEWLKPGRAARLVHEGALGVNPDQRMHEDARHLSELSGDLGVQLLQSSILLVTFVEVLWVLSRGFTFHYHGHVFDIPGYMVWAAIIYAGAGSLLSYWVGGSLIPKNAERYQRESELRYSLMQVNQHLPTIATTGGEEEAQRRILNDLGAVLVAMGKLVTGLTNLTWVTAGYGWLSLVAPILAAAPAYFAGDLSFGGMMMAAGAFNQVQSSLRWFVDNFPTIADWRATLLRVASFRRALILEPVEDVGPELVKAP